MNHFVSSASSSSISLD